jgi:hypothetical protein
MPRQTRIGGTGAVHHIIGWHLGTPAVYKAVREGEKIVKTEGLGLE